MEAVVQRYGVSDDDAFAVGLTCGGIMDILVESIDRQRFPELEGDRRVGEAPRAGRHRNRRRTDQKRRVPARGAAGGLAGSHGWETLGSAPARCRGEPTTPAASLAAGHTTTLRLGPDGERRLDTLAVLVESMAPPPRMFVFGAIDFAAAVARVGASRLPRDGATPARSSRPPRRFPEADEVVVEWPHRYLAQEFAAGRVDARTALCVLTHDPKFDVPLLEIALRTPAAYIGGRGRDAPTRTGSGDFARWSQRPGAESAGFADRARHRRPYAGGDGRLGRRRDRPGSMGWVRTAAGRAARTDPPRLRPGPRFPAGDRRTARGRHGVSVAGLVLAAGEGRRFGRPKAVVELEGERLVDRAVRILTEGGCSPVVVVSGAVALTVAGAEVVSNPFWATGMGSSLRAGLAEVTDTEASTVVVLLVDTPWITPTAVRRLVEAGQGSPAAIATYDGRRGHPVVLGRSVWSEVAALAEGDVAAKAWLRAHPESVLEVDCTGQGDPRDVDTPDQLTP